MRTLLPVKIVFGLLILPFVLVVPMLFPMEFVKADEGEVNLAQLEIITDLERSTVSLSISLQNNSLTTVLSNYRFTNSWGLENLLAESEIPQGTKINLNTNQVEIDFGNNPVLPGRLITLNLKFGSSGIKQQGSLKYFSQPGFAPVANTELTTKVLQQKVILPAGWGRPTHISLKPENFREQAGANETVLIMERSYPIEIAWGTEAAGKLTLESEGIDVSSGSVLVGSLLSTSSQQIKLADNWRNNGYTAIYKDDAGNQFLRIPSDTRVNAEIEFSIKSEEPASDYPAMWQEQVSTAVVSNQVGYANYPLPSQFQTKIEQLYLTYANRDLSEESAAESITALIEAITSSYSVEDLTSSSFVIDERGITTDSKKINYAEYLMLLNEGLVRLGVNNQIVLLDRSFLGLPMEFVIKVCAGNCWFYSVEQIPGYSVRHEWELGLQLVGFTGINQLALSEVRNWLSEPTSSRLVRTLSWQGTQSKPVLSFSGADASDTMVDSTTDSNSLVDISLNLPGKIENFANFQGTVGITNNSNAVIYLYNLLLDKNLFPIIEDTITGLHLGVLPGETREYEISNLFLPKVFWGASTDLKFQVLLLYQSDSEYEVFATERDVVLQQNLLFSGLVIIMILAGLVGIVILTMLLHINRDLVVSRFWKFRRSLSDMYWYLTNSKLVLRYKPNLTALRKFFRM